MRFIRLPSRFERTRSIPYASARPALSAAALVAASSALVLGQACGDDEGSSGTGGSAGNANAAGSAGASGDAGSSGASGQAGNAGTGGGGSITPDPNKNCEAAANPSVPPLQLTPIAGGLASPVYLAQPRGESERLFVVEKPGTIVILRDGEVVEPPFLDIGELVSERGGEMGLLGLAFHPDYANNGRFYVYYSTIEDGPHRSRIAEYTVSDANADLANPDSARVLLEFDQPEDNHNGGALEFGLDGFLYIASGDGGGGGDQHGPIGNGQNLDTLLGKILRIDVDGSGAGANGAYAIPAGNMTGEARPEIWSYGLRNPWRFSFDACTGDMYIADVGQNEIEEVDFEPAGLGGRNYGWRLMEGDACFNPDSNCDPVAQNLVLPVATYDHDTGDSITGGYVYRGSAIPELRGTYLYADFGSSEFFALRMSGGSVAQSQQLITENINGDGAISDISSFGQDDAGELYVMSILGSLFRIDAE